MKSSKQPLQQKSGKDSISNMPVQKQDKRNFVGLTQEEGIYQKMANTSGKVMGQASVQLMATGWTDQHTTSYKDFRSEGKKNTARILQRKGNNTTGLPDQLKTGAENLSGYSLNDVKVHYNSSRPAQLQAHAFAQGTDIHLAPGQEKHLPHETWHVVQQKQGRVKPTAQLQKGVAVNEDKHLENEADKMGEKAAGIGENTTVQKRTVTLSSTAQPLQMGKKAKEKKKEKRAPLGDIFRANQDIAAIKGGTYTGDADARLEEIQEMAEGIIKKAESESPALLEIALNDARFVGEIVNSVLKEWTLTNLAKEDGPGINLMLDTIIKDYPPGKHLYTGIGASPELLIAMLKLRGFRTASIPVSGVKNSEPKNETETQNAIDDIVGWLGGAANKNIDILLMDATDTNATLSVISGLIKKHDKQQKLSRQVKTLSITQTKTEKAGKREKVKDSDIDVLENDNKKVRELMRNRFFFQWYKTNLGRAVKKRDFSEVVEGNNPVVEMDEKAQERIQLFAIALSVNLKDPKLRIIKEALVVKKQVSDLIIDRL